MNKTFEEESAGEMRNSFVLDDEEKEIPEITPVLKRRIKSDLFKVIGTNTGNPATIFNRTLRTIQKPLHTQQEEDDISVNWFDKFMTQRKTNFSSFNDISGSDKPVALNLSCEDQEDIDQTQEFDADEVVDRNSIFACKFTEKSSQMLKGCFETIKKIHGGKLSNQMCEIKVMPLKRIWLENNIGRHVRCVVPEQVVFTVAAQPGRKSDVLTVIFKRQPKKQYSCFSFAKYSSTFKNEVQIAVSAMKIRDILKELGKHQSIGMLIKNKGGLKKCFLMISGQSTKFNFTMDVMNMEELNPELASFVPPRESQSENFENEDNQTVLVEPEEEARGAVVAARSSPNDILASIVFNHESLKKDIDALKSFGEIGELHIVKLPVNQSGEEEEYWTDFRTKSSGTEAKVPMSKDGVHNITKIHIKQNCEIEVLGRPVSLSLQVLSNILSLTNMSMVKMDIHDLQGVGMFFKFAPAYGQGQVNYYFNQINSENIQVLPMTEDSASLDDFE